MPIYSLEPMKLETLKTYIKTPLKPGLFSLLSFLQILLLYLVKSQIVPFNYVFIIKTSITFIMKN